MIWRLAFFTVFVRTRPIVLLKLRGVKDVSSAPAASGTVILAARSTAQRARVPVQEPPAPPCLARRAPTGTTRRADAFHAAHPPPPLPRSTARPASPRTAGACARARSDQPPPPPPRPPPAHAPRAVPSPDPAIARTRRSRPLPPSVHGTPRLAPDRGRLRSRSRRPSSASASASASGRPPARPPARHGTHLGGVAAWGRRRAMAGGGGGGAGPSRPASRRQLLHGDLGAGGGRVVDQRRPPPRNRKAGPTGEGLTAPGRRPRATPWGVLLTEALLVTRGVHTGTSAAGPAGPGTYRPRACRPARASR